MHLDVTKSIRAALEKLDFRVCSLDASIDGTLRKRIEQDGILSDTLLLLVAILNAAVIKRVNIENRVPPTGPSVRVFFSDPRGFGDEEEDGFSVAFYHRPDRYAHAA